VRAGIALSQLTGEEKVEREAERSKGRSTVDGEERLSEMNGK
jgi:hypothetical protein